LQETRRVLKEKGRLVIKIPDFDRMLDSWRRNDGAIFSNLIGSFFYYTPTWKNRQIPDCLDYRAAYMFCGFWNDEYGHFYARRIKTSKKAYNGPPLVSTEFLHDLIKTKTPSQISAELRKVVIENEESYTFHHQNAWSRKELEEELNRAGLSVRSFDKETILKACADVPTIFQAPESMYCLAGKA
jgi:hypothetical protein